MKRRFLYWAVLSVCAFIGAGLLYINNGHEVGEVVKFPTMRSVISGIVIPHHDIVARQRKEFLQLVAQKVHPKTIILVSPNHYDVGRAQIQTVDQDWNLSEGVIRSRSDVVKELIENGVGDEGGSFMDEHGIRLVLANIHSAFPEANIVPIIIKSTASANDVSKLADVLVRTCDRCLMVSSIDFSHDQPALLADLHDTLTIRALKSLDEGALLHSAEVDSPPALLLFAQWAKRSNTEHFSLWKHANSGELVQNLDIPSTTYLFGWYEAGERAQSQKSVTFLFGGDVMLGRMIAHTFLPKGMATVFDKIGERAFWGVDAGVINLEGPISKVPIPDDSRSKTLIFNFPPQAINALKYLRINGASLANNHTANQHKKGLDDTVSILQQANIQAIGGPGNDHVPKVGVFPGNGLKLVVIGVHALYEPLGISELIASYKKDADSRVVIFPHWGAEYQPRHGAKQAELARRWIDAGADMVIGSHPHVIQDAEVYKGKPIIYSLGNFVFDQNFSIETQQGLLIAGSFTDEGLTLFGLPLEAIKYQPTLMSGVRKNAILRELYRPLEKYIQRSSLGDRVFIPL